MTKTAPRVRQINLYTVEQDGQPVAQAMAISQAEAVRLYVESVQQPTMTARLSSPLEARTLAGLPLLTRGETVRNEATPDLFDGAPAAPVSPVVGAVVDPVLPATYCPPVELVVWLPLSNRTLDPAKITPPKDPPDHGHYGCDGVYRYLPEAPPQHAPIAAVLEDLASGEPMPSALSTAAPTASHAHAGGDAFPASAEAPTLAERMAGAYAAGMEIARQGHTRWSAAFLDADVAALSGLREDAADDVQSELLRGFDDGKAQADQADTQGRRRLFAEEPKGAGKAPVKYRNSETGESWSGRGLRPAWLRIAIDGGRAQEDFLI